MFSHKRGLCDPPTRGPATQAIRNPAARLRPLPRESARYEGGLHRRVPRPAFGEVRGPAALSWVRSPASVRSRDDCFSATRPGRRPPPARSLCEDRAHRRRQIRTLGFAQEDPSATGPLTIAFGFRSRRC
jgi:hypothetical protein